MFSKIYEKIKNYIKENKGFLISLIIIILVFTIKLPYVIYVPGGHVNLNDRITVPGATDINGSYNMAYVSVYNATLPTVLLSYIIPNWDLVSNEEITLDNQDMDELLITNKLQMESSKDIATMLAYSHASKELNITKEVVNVSYIFEEAKTDMLVGDAILKIDDIHINKISDLESVLSTKKVGDTINILVSRDDKQVMTTATLSLIDNEPKIGIAFVTTYEYTNNPEITIDSKASESGPSGGLMLTLAIYDNLVEEDLSNDLKIVGTGTIDEEGNVGKIDGVKYKILGSKDADIFFCPIENYLEAALVIMQYDLDIELHGVTNFSEAVAILESK